MTARIPTPHIDLATDDRTGSGAALPKTREYHTIFGG